MTFVENYLIRCAEAQKCGFTDACPCCGSKRKCTQNSIATDVCNIRICDECFITELDNRKKNVLPNPAFWACFKTDYPSYKAHGVKTDDAESAIRRQIYDLMAVYNSYAHNKYGSDNVMYKYDIEKILMHKVDNFSIWLPVGEMISEFETADGAVFLRMKRSDGQTVYSLESHRKTINMPPDEA